MLLYRSSGDFVEFQLHESNNKRLYGYKLNVEHWCFIIIIITITSILVFIIIIYLCYYVLAFIFIFCVFR